ncbi:TPA: hypothetical protein N0F65_001305 [Lagenidium giganteum]|uniref:Acyltransferase n=1 Tax=Lagenidium giganteum TaxID=4803 RepID=A0AAV2YZG5_9STRA|nr:TPA: hypothetical protein N0F65_001305 [Lagenidium giganteum]
MLRSDNAMSGVQRTWPVSLALAVAAVAVCWSLGVAWRWCVLCSGLACYLPSYLDGSEYTGERYWPWFAKVAKGYSKAIPATLEYEAPMDKSQQYLYCSHPHGILSAHHGVLLAGSSEPSFHDVAPIADRRHLAASVCFRIPFYREYLLWLGCVDARRDIAEKMLKEGKSLVILVGGIAEQMLSQRGEQTIYVNKRKGHIRLALQYGVPIVPGYAFGETDLYTHSSFLLSLRRSISQKLSMALLVAYGSSRWLPFLPHEGVVINQVFGKPIPVKRNPTPTREEIDELHKTYVNELIRIFDTHKEKFGYKDHVLQVL